MMAKRGRPPTFDREEAICRAMEQFWARGYEGTTLEDLQSAMGGITPPSFYNAFRSKEKLFKEAANLYVATFGEPTVRSLEQATTAREGLETMLRQTAKFLSQPGKPHGCLLVLGAMNCTPANKGAQDYLQAIRRQAPMVLKHRLDRSVTQGELSAELDTNGVAAFYATVIHGLGIRAGDGASRKELMAAVDGAMAAWETLVGMPTTKKSGRKRSPT
jgi:AcrR family transcriptional regulator